MPKISFSIHIFGAKCFQLQQKSRTKIQATRAAYFYRISIRYQLQLTRRVSSGKAKIQQCQDTEAAPAPFPLLRLHPIISSTLLFLLKKRRRGILPQKRLLLQKLQAFLAAAPTISSMCQKAFTFKSLAHWPNYVKKKTTKKIFGLLKQTQKPLNQLLKPKKLYQKGFTI